MKFHTNLICQTIDVAGNSSHINDSLHSFCNILGEVTSPLFKVILYSYLILKKMNERITDS